mgnify:FL=1|jgi:hypothetical protein
MRPLNNKLVVAIKIIIIIVLLVVSLLNGDVETVDALLRAAVGGLL